MLSFLKTKKSAGVRVTRAVHRLIDLGNQARRDGNWGDAAESYRKAVTIDPSLTHIWMQLGHAEKERRRFGEAEAAYARAAALAPSSADPFLHLGHLNKMSGNLPAAIRAYLTAARLTTADPNSLEELHRLIADSSPMARVDLTRLLRGEVFGEAEAVRMPPVPDGALMLDISSLVSAALAGRNFDEIGLVGHKLASALIEQSDRPVVMCAHVVGHGRWLAIHPAQFARIAALGLYNSDTGPLERQVAVTDLDLFFLLSEPFAFAEGATLVDLDADFAPADHALFVRHARQRSHAHYIAFGNNVAPALAREADRVIQTGNEEASVDAILNALAAPREVRPPAPASEARIARIESAGLDGAFRTGTGWLPPESWGCWATMPGGELEIAVPRLARPRLYVQLRALPADATEFQLRLTDGRTITGEIPASEFKWIMVDDLPIADGVTKLAIRGNRGKLVPIEGVSRKLPAMIGVAGFMLCDHDDQQARLHLLEAVTLGTFDGLR